MAGINHNDLPCSTMCCTPTPLGWVVLSDQWGDYTGTSALS